MKEALVQDGCPSPQPSPRSQTRGARERSFTEPCGTNIGFKCRRGSSGWRGERGYLLLETLIYIPVLLVLMGVGLAAFYKGLENSRGLHRNASDITRVLQAGEQWREDIRKAQGPVRKLEGEDWASLEIPDGHRTIIYLFMEEAIWRAEHFDGPWELWLPEVADSEMARDEREHVAAWKWDVELAGRKGSHPGRLKPVFSFLAVTRNQSESGTEQPEE